MIHISFDDVIRGGRTIIRAGTISVADGEKVGLVGLNGAGKSTWMSALAGVIASSVRIARGNTPVEQIALMLQSPALPPWLTVWELISMSVETAVEPTPLLEAWGISELAHVRVVALSTGQRQFVAATITASTPADLRLFDEPFAALDNMHRRRLITQLLTAVPEAAIISAQASADLFDACSRFIVLNNGMITDVGTRADLLAREAGNDLAAFEAALLTHVSAEDTSDE